MILLVEREHSQLGCTHGKLFLDGNYFCETLEDAIREVKVPGITAIPPGTYKVTLDYSNRFQRMMPHVLNVPDFTGIRIHYGNTAEDTAGCLLVGTTRTEREVRNSRTAFDRLFPLIKQALDNSQPVTIQYINPAG